MNRVRRTGGRGQHPVALLVPPRADVARELGEVCRPLSWVPNAVYHGVMRRFSLPGVVSGVLRCEDGPQHPAGWLITVPVAPAELLTGSARARHAIDHAVTQARDLGAQTVGLGGLIATATDDGRVLQHRRDIGLTNGHAFTAAMLFQGVQRLLGLCPVGCRVAVVDAGTGLGRSLTGLLARRSAGPLLLLEPDEDRRRTLPADLEASRTEITPDLTRLGAADLVVLLGPDNATPLEDGFLRAHLKPGAIVLDAAQPRLTRPELLLTRPDVRVVDGGLVSAPGVRRRGGGWPTGLLSAALAETLLLGLTGQQGHFSVGAASVTQAEYLLGLARRYAHLGFHLAPPHSFGQRINLNRRFEQASWSGSGVALA
ncbi:semialdehyde dehydrogenase [Deinococcus aerophilus]|uniref:semialdehyde dehydrogenase n=1 Tax=Deinococcus aerophilus TaxID=522488 RepID=UPI00166F2CA3|nr:semialdehyde dehydrogenase [Deinococcus aerophilus]